MATVPASVRMGNSVEIDRDEGVMRAVRQLRHSGGSTVLTMPSELMENVGLEEGDDVILEAEILGDQIRIRAAEEQEGDE